MPNRLAHENSPYLIQHSNNPVNWYPWGQEALARARAEDKPIFLSIGYAACHWCHVMEHESFENEAIAALMNEHFINIKVDREERPDLDTIYMSATMAMTGSGGWPMSVFLTPDLRPFYTGTYFPPIPRFNMPSFHDVLASIARAWQDEREKVDAIGARVTGHIQRQSAWKDTGFVFSQELLDGAAKYLHDSYDWGFGGWGQAPKFPQPMSIEFLLRRSHTPLHGASPAPAPGGKWENAAIHALEAMSKGGMCDVVGGGFARYSVDNLSRTPHFEKMLYDNAQLAQAYLHGYQVTGNPRFRQVCEETLDFILRELTHPSGGFFSSLDADSEGVEGKFYVWAPQEIQKALDNPADADFIMAAYGVTPTGNFDGRNILQRAMTDEQLAQKFSLPASDVPARLSQLRARLLEARSERVRPGTDDKVLVFWNALALAAFAEAGRALGRADYLEAASRNADFLLENLHIDRRLLRSWRAGQARHNACLEDYASLILALLALYQSDFNPKWYTSALELADEMIDNYADPDGGFFDTGKDHESLLLRPKDLQDNATPSGNALAAEALLHLAAFSDRADYRTLGEQSFRLIAESALRYPTAFARWLIAADFALAQVKQLAILGDPGAAGTKEMIEAARETYRPHLVVAASPFPPPADAPALLQDRPLVNGKPAAYVCEGFTCKTPVTTTEELKKLL
ncbi:MAG: thioredoxin domain-containing protein [Chloroflexi bacterium]|nr:MAG: thioredoxin domain-containing protein [Chloroflexota bacterium]